MPLLNGVWLIGPDGIPHQVPNDQAVLDYFGGRGYTVTDLPSHLDSDDEEFQAALAELQAEEGPELAEPVESVEPVAAKSATEKKKEVK